uniref:RRM domain-containing protein n=2 Tax=Aegilops tauschii TaxID=37682 RepID=A0A453GWL1_AEGTS|nr:31 kDa ribonucleoprotein, chloroplastic-like [Aegilops tauschii subsp. strangulata]
MAPVQEFNRSSLEAHGVKRQETTGPTHVIHVGRCYEPCFKVLVYNLPLTVKSSQLRLLFSNHGKVFSTEVICYKKTKRSRCIGHVTMSTSHAHLEYALDALSGLVLEGCNLHISLVKEGRPQQQRKKLPSFIGAAVQLHIGPFSWFWL